MSTRGERRRALREATHQRANGVMVPTQQPQQCSDLILLVDHHGGSELELHYRCTGPLGADRKGQATILRRQADALDPPEIPRARMVLP